MTVARVLPLPWGMGQMATIAAALTWLASAGCSPTLLDQMSGTPVQQTDEELDVEKWPRDASAGITISGSVTRIADAAGTIAPVQSAVLKLTGVDASIGRNFSVAPNSQGRYAAVVPPGWSGTLEASDPATWVLTPPSLLVTDVQEAMQGVNFSAARNYHVAVTGSDSNGGTARTGDEFRTIQKAANLVRPGDTVYVKSGRYRERVLVSRSGTVEAPITFTGYAGAVPVIDAQRTRVQCFYLGSVRHVVIDGFETVNTKPGSTPAHIGVVNSSFVTVRNCHCYQENWTGRAADEVKGIFVTGQSEDVLVEYNHVHHVMNGIGARQSGSGSTARYPNRVTIRNNHVHHCHTTNTTSQNNTTGICFGNGVLGGIIEHNVVHHCDDFCIGINETLGSTIMRYNVVYRAKYMGGGGGGNGIKSKPVHIHTRGSTDYVYGNIAFLNYTGIHMIVYEADGRGHHVYHNTSAKNSVDGINYGTNSLPDGVTLVRNNIFTQNANRDLKMHSLSPPGAVEYNYVEDGVGVDLAKSPGTKTERNSDLVQFNMLKLLNVDSNGDRTPDVLDPLNGLRTFSTTQAALEFTRGKMIEIFGLKSVSPAIDAGMDVDMVPVDFLDQEYYGARDMGALEHPAR